MDKRSPLLAVNFYFLIEDYNSEGFRRESYLWYRSTYDKKIKGGHKLKPSTLQKIQESIKAHQ